MKEDLDGPERRQGYTELKMRIDEHAEFVEDRLKRFFFRALVAFAVIGVATAVSLAGFGFVLNEQSDQSDEIQDQRYDTLVNSCLDQNDRHARTVRKASTFPKRSRIIVISLVDELVPTRKDCSAYADSRVRGE